MRIEDVDQNFLVNAQFDTSDLAFYDILEAPFQINGLMLPQDKADKFKRIPTELARQVNEGVLYLHACTAGGRIRFKTNAAKIAIFVKMGLVGKMSHFPLTGSAGFDLYVDNCYERTFTPPYDLEERYSSIVQLENNREKNVMIHFPLYSEVVSVTIGLEKEAYVAAPDPYGFEKPVVYYGSSITQGGCASRPGNAYQSIISRRLNCDHINLGFSGSAQGEQIMADYIAQLSMEAFVYDYDHNAPTVEHLEKTHQKMFETIRKQNPELPIVMVTRPQLVPNEDSEARREIIYRTYQAALDAGDTKVWFIDGGQMMRDFADDCATVDNCHPNDLGFWAMAKGIGNVLAEILK